MAVLRRGRQSGYMAGANKMRVAFEHIVWIGAE
jgi:hypothetical protein